MLLDCNIRYSKLKNQPHLHLYVSEEQYKTMPHHLTCIAQVNSLIYDEEILKKLHNAFWKGIFYVQIKKESKVEIYKND